MRFTKIKKEKEYRFFRNVERMCRAVQRVLGEEEGYEYFCKYGRFFGGVKPYGIKLPYIESN